MIGDPAGGSNPRFPALPGARDEARRVAALLTEAGYAVTALDERHAALEVQSAILAGSWDVVHIAAHGVVDYREKEPEPPVPGGRRPMLQTGIVLGGDPVEIIGSDFFNQLQTVPDLVFVNCCLVGKVKVDPPLYQPRRSSSSRARARWWPLAGRWTTRWR